MFLVYTHQRIRFLIILCEHIPQVIVIADMFWQVLLRQRRFDSKQVLENLEILTIDLLQLRLSIVVLPNCHNLTVGICKIRQRVRSQIVWNVQVHGIV